MQDIVDQIYSFLQQVILPNWPDLIALMPWVLVAIIIVSLVGLAWAWWRSGRRNRSRVPRPLAGGAPPAGVHLPGPSRWPFVVPIGAALMLFSFVLRDRNAAGEPTGPAINLWLFIIGLVVVLVGVIGWLYDAMREWRATDQPELATHPALPAGPATAAVELPDRTSAAVALVPAGARGLQPITPAEETPPPEAPPGVHMPGPSPWPFFAPIAMAVILYGLIFSAVLLVGGVILALIAMAGWYRQASRDYRSTEAVGHTMPATQDAVRAWPRRLVPVFTWIIVVSFAIALAPIALGALNGLTPPAATPTPLNVPAKPEISAQGLAFNTNTLIVPAGRPFELVFINNDAGVPHNVQIDDSPARNTTLFDGEVVDGVTTITYQVPALQPGDYYFLCKIHPNMNGTLKAIPESGGAGNGPAGSPAQ